MHLLALVAYHNEGLICTLSMHHICVPQELYKSFEEYHSSKIACGNQQLGSTPAYYLLFMMRTPFYATVYYRLN